MSNSLNLKDVQEILEAEKIKENISGKCMKCGSAILDLVQIFAKYKSYPKYCEGCRRTIQDYRKKSDPINRIELERYENVYFVDFPFQKEKDGEDEFDVYCYGGRNFGSFWSGVSYDYKYLIYVPKAFHRDTCCRIRKMEKSKENQKWIYLVIEQFLTDKYFEPQYIHNIETYYKTTTKGYGRDRNTNVTIESEYKVLLDVSSSARSGRFGNNNKLLISPDKKLKIEYGGQE